MNLNNTRKLILSCKSVEYDAFSLTRLLSKNESSRVLILDNIEPHLIIEILQSLNVRKLLLWMTNLGEDELAQLVKLLDTNKMLNTLILNNTSLRDSGEKGGHDF